MSAGETDIIKKTDNFVESLVDDEVVLMDINDGRFFSLDETARRIWELIDDHPTIEALSEKMLDEYDVGEGQCLAAVKRIVGDFTENKVIEVNAQ